MFEQAIDVEKAGTSIENDHHSIFLVSHLYNAVLQFGLLQTHWPELDRVIEQHMDVIFAGSFPTTEKDQGARLQWQLGFNTTQLPTKSQHLSRLKTRPKMFNGPQLTNSKISEVFRQYFDKKKSMEQCLYDLETLIQTDSMASSKKSGTSKALKKRTLHRQLTPIEVLRHIRTWIPNTIRELQVDCISLVRTCNILLRKIRQEINDQIGDGWGRPRYTESASYKSGEDSNDAALINMVQDIFAEGIQSQEAADIVFKGSLSRERDGASRGGPRLHVVGEVMETSIKGQVLEDEKSKSVLTRKPQIKSPRAGEARVEGTV